MKIAVIGGTGLIGSKLVAKLKEDGHSALSATPASGVDAITGEGLALALEGAEVVVDVMNTRSYEVGAALDFFTTSTHNLLKAEAAAGVAHHLTLSAVGTKRLSESPYFRGKIAQEELIRDSSIPYTIVHATQFFEFVRGIAEATTRDGAVRLAPVAVEPIAADEVAAALAELSQGPATGGIVEVAGPEQLLLDQFVRHGLLAQGERRPVVPDPHASFFGADLHDRILLPKPGARHGDLRFHDWLSQHTKA